jgi:hypothetical protein
MLKNLSSDHQTIAIAMLIRESFANVLSDELSLGESLRESLKGLDIDIKADDGARRQKPAVKQLPVRQSVVCKRTVSASKMSHRPTSLAGLGTMLDDEVYAVTDQIHLEPCA